jgi:hypothetical protein
MQATHQTALLYDASHQIVIVFEAQAILLYYKIIQTISIEYGSDSPPLCGETSSLQSESLDSGANPLP